MNQKIENEDIDKSHGLRNPKKYIKAKPQPIIVKFVSYTTNTIYRNKKVLKRKGINVTKSLTAKGIRMLGKQGNCMHLWMYGQKMARLFSLIRP